MSKKIKRRGRGGSQRVVVFLCVPLRFFKSSQKIIKSLLGIAISEAVEDAATHENTKYSLGSVLNHVMLHQTIIGQEAMTQLAKVDDYPDVLLGCVGGGSNFSGINLLFLQDKIKNGKEIDVVAVEPSACPTLTGGEFRYDFGDMAEMTPLLKMYTLGHEFVPPPIHAGRAEISWKFSCLKPAVCGRPYEGCGLSSDRDI